MDKIKIVVAHPYQQHSFRTAAAIKRAGFLQRYITTVYDKRTSLTGLAKSVLSGDNLERANGRKSSQIEDNEVLQFCELRSLFLLLLYRIDRKKKLYNLLNRNILWAYNKKLADYVCHYDTDILIVYDTVSLESIRRIKKDNNRVKIVMDMSAPSLPYMDSFFWKSIEAGQEKDSILRRELVSRAYQNALKNAVEEIRGVDYFLVASQFSKCSLEYMGIPEDRIYLCRYGMEVDHQVSVEKRTHDRLQCVFIGNVSQKKGFHSFIKVARELRYHAIDFHVLGSYNNEDPLYTENQDLCRFYGHVTRNQVLRTCEDMDIIIFSSLSDGFGLSVIEAMSRGVVPIVSKNAGVSDLIEDGVNGFIFEYWDTDLILARCKELLEDRNRLQKMSASAYQKVKSLEWKHYDEQVMSAVESILQKRK